VNIPPSPLVPLDSQSKAGWRAGAGSPGLSSQPQPQAPGTASENQKHTLRSTASHRGVFFYLTARKERKNVAGLFYISRYFTLSNFRIFDFSPFYNSLCIHLLSTALSQQKHPQATSVYLQS